MRGAGSCPGATVPWGPVGAEAVPKSRETWIDVAKGMAIILVVLFHASTFMDEIGLAGSWGRLAVSMDTFRMPLFFFTAGIFAAQS